MRGKFNSWGFGTGPRLGAEIDLGEQTGSKGPGATIGGSASASAGAGFYGNGGWTVNNNGSQSVSYGHGVSFGASIGVSANMTFSF